MNSALKANFGSAFQQKQSKSFGNVLQAPITELINHPASKKSETVSDIQLNKENVESSDQLTFFRSLKQHLNT